MKHSPVPCQPTFDEGNDTLCAPSVRHVKWITGGTEACPRPISQFFLR